MQLNCTPVHSQLPDWFVVYVVRPWIWGCTHFALNSYIAVHIIKQLFIPSSVHGWSESTFILRRIMWGRGFVDFCGRKQLQLDYERPCSIDYRSFIQPPCISLFLQVQYSNQENCINLCYPGINVYVEECSWSHFSLQIWNKKNTDIWDRNIVCTK